MKFLFLLAGAIFLVWLFRPKKASNKLQDDKQSSTPNSTVEMVSCAHCGLHIPKADSVSGKQGSYCNAEHQRAAEG